ncbi:PREDICTED: GDSL esterase/lipase 1-like [Ipomoea nil]|uniref:GDSL esterase/lipase 1-like n=1 Tax=Ipomoea nil TaxID=35883 RepID=UPI0009014327|nr:PREDICTED: GDSL esterase/lipase 1-like [Ipomoea nil]XP_019168152.1 PREDICTED: GDSL esterase/lipase 1-like [Ipomoea nil]
MGSLYSYMYALALLCSLANPLLCLAHHNHVALFVFGDSLFDPGNNNFINTTTDFQANFWPYGHSFFKYPTGRFSDGRLVPDFIAEFAKLPLIPGYFQAEEQRGYVNGVNFASGGAGSLVETHSGFVIDLNTQLQYFKNIIKELKGKLGDKESNKLLSSAVYMFSNGGNDYFSLFTTNSTIFNSYTKEEYVDMVIHSFINVIKEVYKEGGRKFVIFSAAPLACLPYSRALKFQQTNRTGCEKKFRVLTEIHNKVLPNKLIELEKALQGFKYSYFDFFQAATDIIDHPSRYGFKEAKTACCGSGPYRGLSSCGGKRGQLKEYELCKDVRDYMFFDNFHPTEKSNLHFATLLWNGVPNVVRSCSVKSLFEQVL